MVSNEDVNQHIDGDQNLQINSGKDTIAAVGDGSIAVGGNYVVNNKIDNNKLSKINQSVDELSKKVEIIFQEFGLTRELLASKQIDLDHLIYTAKKASPELSFEELYFLQRDSTLKLNYEETLSYQFQMLELSQRDSDDVAEYWSRVCLLTTSCLFEGQEFPEEASMEISNHALSLSIENSIQRMEVDSLTLIGAIYFRRKEFANSIATFCKCIPISVVLNEIDELVSHYAWIAQNYVMLGDIIQAERLVDFAFQLIDRSEISPIVYCSILIASAAILMGKIEQVENQERERIITELNDVANRFVEVCNVNRIPHVGPQNFLHGIRESIKLGRWY